MSEAGPETVDLAVTTQQKSRFKASNATKPQALRTAEGTASEARISMIPSFAKAAGKPLTQSNSTPTMPPPKPPQVPPLTPHQPPTVRCRASLESQPPRNRIAQTERIPIDRRVPFNRPSVTPLQPINQASPGQDRRPSLTQIERLQVQDKAASGPRRFSQDATVSGYDDSDAGKDLVALGLGGIPAVPKAPQVPPPASEVTADVTSEPTISKPGTPVNIPSDAEDEVDYDSDTPSLASARDKNPHIVAPTPDSSNTSRGAHVETPTNVQTWGSRLLEKIDQQSSIELQAFLRGVMHRVQNLPKSSQAAEPKIRSEVARELETLFHLVTDRSSEEVRGMARAVEEVCIGTGRQGDDANGSTKSGRIENPSEKAHVSPPASSPPSTSRLFALSQDHGVDQRPKVVVRKHTLPSVPRKRSAAEMSDSQAGSSPGKVRILADSDHRIVVRRVSPPEIAETNVAASQTVTVVNADSSAVTLAQTPELLLNVGPSSRAQVPVPLPMLPVAPRPPESEVDSLADDCIMILSSSKMSGNPVQNGHRKFTGTFASGVSEPAKQKKVPQEGNVLERAKVERSLKESRMKFAEELDSMLWR
ncbi:hypothetical protein HKX48_000325 [Thoreauomyces humboldtii]|nr:hypothetical protein HKX48_000325 [Thoreauomyces humboldtii]